MGWGVYNLDPPQLVRRQLTFDEARAFNQLVLTTTAPIYPMRPFALRGAVDDYTRALSCLSQAVYYEAANESTEGQQAVAQVVLNRLQHPNYPKTVCGVVYQGSQLSTGCQFSFTCDGSLNRMPPEASWLRARGVAEQALNGFVYSGVGTATHYHADYVFPYWAVTLVKLRQIGAHIFYRMTGPSGSPDEFSGRYAGGEAVLSSAILTGGDNRTPDAPSVVVAPASILPPQPEPRLVTLTVGGLACVARQEGTRVLSPRAAVAALGRLPPIVVSWEVDALKTQLAEAQRGQRFILQGGDCAESFEDCMSEPVVRRLKILLQMSLVLLHGLKVPITRIGRMAGQYAKPRSADTETRDGLTLPCYRGDLVNRPGFTFEERDPDPTLLLRGYERAALTLNFVRSLVDGGFADLCNQPRENFGQTHLNSPRHCAPAIQEPAGHASAALSSPRGIQVIWRPARQSPRGAKVPTLKQMWLCHFA